MLISDMQAEKKVKIIAKFEHERKGKKTPLNTFFKNDLADEMIDFYLKQTAETVPVTRRGGGYYIYGTQQIYTKMQEGKVYVKQGRDWINFPEFLS